MAQAFALSVLVAGEEIERLPQGIYCVELNVVDNNLKRFFFGG
jgi:hypothetical protein